MEYAILDQLWGESEERLERYLQANPGIYAKMNLTECEESFSGSDPYTRLFIFSNYMSRSGLINLAIIIRETPIAEQEETESEYLKPTTNVTTTIFPMYLTKTPIYDMPEKVEAPEITEQRAKFIIEKRALPKMKANETFDPDRHRWAVNKIAAELNMSNRLVAQYCKANGI